MQAKKLIPYSFAMDKGVLLSRIDQIGAEIWLREDTTPETLAEVRRYLEVPVYAVILDHAKFELALAEVYSRADESATQLADDFEQDMDLSRLVQDMPHIEDLLEAEGDAPVIRMINTLLTQALREGASDIHIEIFENRSVVRFRLDGVLRDMIEPHRALHAALVSRIKIMAQLDIAEKRLPQDGRISLKLAGKPVDVRVSTLPTGHGERVVLRLLDKESGRLDLTKLGMNEATLAEVNMLIAQPHGILLVTGPTGSGKTTTLYAALSNIDSTAMNIMTVEDPIEYDLDGVGQTQINARIEMDFSKALRAILRQDPDVIMIGEIRDLETAQIAVQASLTGHLVLATLHTNDAVSAVTRLIDMGVEPFLLASSLIGVLAQRLVRKLCVKCKRAVVLDAHERATLFSGQTLPEMVYTPVGCEHCDMSGYRGRTGIYELLVMDDTIRHFVHDGTSEQKIRDSATARGMRNLRMDGMRWVAAGVTSIEEILRVTKE
ncbi:MAG: type II secretion system ATPase GspE [Betaproteobacteria bacterium]|nr:type II secretion system ATPase GspE [Betaproteobacteria bacterium]